MENFDYKKLEENSLNSQHIKDEIAVQILNDPNIDLLSLLQVSFNLRKRYFGKEVAIHILNNVQNGNCPEDCSYCAQSKKSSVPIEVYPMKSEEGIMEEAKAAYESGAHRYCMVFSGKGPSHNRVSILENIIKKIKSTYPIEVCVSPGIMNKPELERLKNAGLDRLNHNLNTSRRKYPEICSTHDYSDRIQTLNDASDIGLSLCSGVIIGMGETSEDILALIKDLQSVKALKSVPINFYIPLKGVELKAEQQLSPEYCLRVLCLFRILLPEKDIRIAAGREIYLKSMEPLCLYPANSLFMDGYLNTQGSKRFDLLSMIQEMGFSIKSELPLETLLEKEGKKLNKNKNHNPKALKSKSNLHIE